MSLPAVPASSTAIDTKHTSADVATTGSAPAMAPRWRLILGRLTRTPSAVISAAILAFWIICAIFWPLIAPYNPITPDYAHALAQPSFQHLAGTDTYGRDVMSRVLAGSRVVLIMAPAATAIGLIGGVLLGLLTGYYGGWFDEILNRLLEVVMTFPIIVIALLILSISGASTVNTVLIIGIIYIPLVSRVVRAATQSVRDLDYVAAARLRGARGPAIMLTEILPNISGPIIVEATVRVGYAVFTTASLSFIGLGNGPDSTDWGSMIFALKTYLPIRPSLVMAPTLAIASLVVSLNLLADGIRRAVSL
jgi:peptide/nickel transport system permease protein